MNKAQRKHLSEAMKASHARRKAAQASTTIVEIPLADMPAPPPMARVKPGPRKANGREVDALAQLIVAVYIELKRRT